MKNKNLIIGGIIAMAIIGLYLYFAVKKAKTTTIDQTKVINPDSATALNTAKTPYSSGKIATNSQISKATSLFPLKKGSKGEAVKKLQVWLNSHIKLPFLPLSVDGNFGGLTQSAASRIIGATEISEAWYNANVINQTIVPEPAVDSNPPGFNLWDVVNPFMM